MIQLRVLDWGISFELETWESDHCHGLCGICCHVFSKHSWSQEVFFCSKSWVSPYLHDSVRERCIHLLSLLKLRHSPGVWWQHENLGRRFQKGDFADRIREGWSVVGWSVFFLNSILRWWNSFGLRVDVKMKFPVFFSRWSSSFVFIWWKNSQIRDLLDEFALRKVIIYRRLWTCEMSAESCWRHRVERSTDPGFGQPMWVVWSRLRAPFLKAG